MNIYTSLNPLITEKLQEISIDNLALNEYLELIQKYIENPPEDNYEKHHILPKSLFPEYKKLKNNSWNCVKLPYMEHLESHRLLSIFIECYKLKFAYYSMINKFKNVYGNISDEEYKKARLYNKEHYTVKDKDGNFYFVHKDDPRVLSGELVHNTCGQIVVKDKNNKTYCVTKDDPRYISKELVPMATGMVPVKNAKGEFFSVSKDDPRYLSGEFVYNVTGTVSVKDKDGNNLSVSIDDPRYISGELTHVLKNRITVIDENGNTQSVYNNDPRYLSGELKGVTVGKIMAKNTKTGRNEQADKDDPRFITGELVGISKGMKFCNNGEINKQFYPDKIPEGWKLGRIKKKY